MISPAVVSVTSSGTQRYGLQVDTLQEGIRVTENAITGNLKLVDSYPQFGDEEASNPGHYLALDVTVPEGSTVTTKIDGGTKPDYVDLTSDKFCVYRIKDKDTQKIKIKTRKGEEEVEKTYSLTGLVLQGPTGEDAFDKTKTDYGGFGKTTDFYEEGSVDQVWDGTNCTVTGTLKWVEKSVAPKLGSDGNYFAFKLDDYYKDKTITVTIGETEKTAKDTDWVCRISDDRKTITVKDGTTVIAMFNLDGAVLSPAV